MARAAAASSALDSLPWRGPGPGRPELSLPPARLPRRRNGSWRKRWRYVAVFGDEVLACAGRVQVGYLGQTFWLVWDRRRERMWEQTRPRLLFARGEVWTQALEGEGLIDHAPDKGSMVRIEGSDPEGHKVRAFLRFGGGQWAEAVCQAEPDNYVWTRKRADVPVEADIRVGEERFRFEAQGMEDETEGYHPAHTVWDWSAGVGRAADGRSVGWNLVSGINDPPEHSERAIWIDGKPLEPGPVEFEGLDAIAFDDGARLRFSAECERNKEEKNPFVRYSYRQPFGTFTGALPGGIELERGIGVMEHHDAHW